MKYLKPIVILLIIMIFAGCSQTDYPLAKVGNRYLYKSQFERIFPGVKNTNDFDLVREKAIVNLDNLVTQMAILEMMLIDETTSNEILTYYNQSINSAFIQAVYKRAVTDQIHVNEYEIWDQYKRMNTTAWTQHILVEEKSLADSLYAVLMDEPAKFGILASKFSLDTNNKDNNGNLKPFSGGKFVKEFEDAAFSQPIGVIGEPVKSTFGYHIIKVNKRVFKSLENFEDDKVSIKNTLASKKKQDLEVASMEYYENMAMISYYENNLETFIKNVDNSMINAKPEDISWELRKLPLVQSMFGTWTYDSIYKYNEINKFGTLPTTNVDAFKDYMKRISFFMALFDSGKRMGVALDENMKKEIYLKLAISAEQEMSKQLRMNAPVNDSVLKDYYNNNKNEFMEKGSMGMFIISNPDRAVLEVLIDSIDAEKKPFEEYSRIYSTQKPKEFSKPAYYVKQQDDTTGYYEKALDLGEVGAVSEIFANQFGYNIIKVTMINPPKLKDFDKNLSRVKNAYISHIINDAKADEYERAKAEIGIEIYENNLDKFVRDIIKNQ